jgi:DNA-binding MarR family transcriptional regulator/GNAT superfamily N-acetyltransferase/photosystem II stability/assembly factor-like uncharacterized protein
MTDKVFVLVGTRRGAFILESRDRRQWSLRGPYCDALAINHMIADPASGTLYAAGGNPFFGLSVWRSRDLGESWTKSGEGLAYGADEPPLKGLWSLARSGGALYCGADPAGLFKSDDDGETWRHVAGLRAHPSRPEWQPGGAGLILHAVVPHPEDARRLYVAISAAGVFATEDGGETWAPRNRGTRADFMPEGMRYPEFGQCVHGLVMAPNMPERLYQQNHCGMYRSDDGARTWTSIEVGLPSSFGFPACAHPRDPATLYLLPLNSAEGGRYVPEGKAAVWRTRDGGASWQDLRQGLPQQNAFFGVLRQAMAADRLAPAGVYFGTNTGTLFASADEGESWTAIAQHLPTICSVERRSSSQILDSVKQSADACAMTASAREIAAIRRFNRFYTRAIGVVQDAILGSDFSLAEARVLYEIAHRKGASAREIATALRLDEAYLSRILAGFARRGLIVRERATSDARRKGLALTPPGAKALAPLEQRSNKAAARLLDPLSAAERARAIVAMRTIAGLLGEPEPEDDVIELRPHRAGDLGWVISRHGALYAEEHGFGPEIEALAAEIAARFIRRHDPKRERCWIAMKGGARAGAVMLVRRSARIAQLRILFVEPGARGAGIGARLVAQCIAFAREAGYRKITLWTNDMLAAARRLYERAGFRLVAEEPHSEFGRRMVGQIWELAL